MDCSLLLICAECELKWCFCSVLWGVISVLPHTPSLRASSAVLLTCIFYVFLYYFIKPWHFLSALNCLVLRVMPRFPWEHICNGWVNIKTRISYSSAEFSETYEDSGKWQSRKIQKVNRGTSLRNLKIVTITCSFMETKTALQRHCCPRNWLC